MWNVLNLGHFKLLSRILASWSALVYAESAARQSILTSAGVHLNELGTCYCTILIVIFAKCEHTLAKLNKVQRREKRYKTKSWNMDNWKN